LRPGGRRLLPAAAPGRAPHGFVAALKAVGRGRQQSQRALDGLQGIPLRAGHQAAQFPDERPHLFFTLVGLALSPVGDGFTLVGLALTLVGLVLALVGLALALVGLALAQVSEGFADDGVLLAPPGVASRLRPRLGLFR
jgi:hypothetical protein